MKKVGVTGGIGSGKSTLCRKLVESGGAHLYDADKWAKELMRTDLEIRSEIIKVFGEQSYIGSEPNREVLSREVFANDEKLQQLNSIVHPRVRDHFSTWVEQLGDAEGFALLESAILFNSGFDSYVDIKIAVLAPSSVRVERVCKRDGLTPEQVQGRMSAQLNDDELYERADISIVNIFEEDLDSNIARIVKMVEGWQK